MNFKRFIALQFIITGLIIFSSTFYSCNKKDDIGEATASISTVDSLNQPLTDVHISVACTTIDKTPCSVRLSGKSNSSGKFDFTYDYAMVLKINAYKIISETTIVGIPPNTVETITTDSVCAETFVSIKPNETTSKLVKLYSCN